MAPKLSTNERELIDQVCTGYQRWTPAPPARPRLERVLPGGHSNRSVELAGGGRWVLRLATSTPRGVCREREARIHAAAAAAGLAPEIRFVDPPRGLLVTEYADPASEPADMQSLAHLRENVTAAATASRYFA